MLTDLSVVAIVGAIALALVSIAMIWVGRAWAVGVLPLRGKASLRTKSMRGNPEAALAGHRAAGPFMERYGRIITGLALLVILVSLVNDITALVLYILALAFLGLGAMVCLRKAEAQAARGEVADAHQSDPVHVEGDAGTRDAVGENR